MSKKLLIGLASIAFVFFSTYFISCSKPNTDTPAITCADKTIVITGTTTNTSGGTATNGSITVSATGSTGFTYNINGGAFQSTGTFNSLAAGTYNIIAKDDAGCTSSKSFTVTATACPTITVTATVTNASSPTSINGAIVASATGSNGFTYSKDGTNFQPTGSFAALAVGNYTITVKDVNGCTGSAIFTVSNVACPTITITSTTTQTAGPTATNGSITAIASGGAAPYTYSKDGTNFQTSNIFTSLAIGNYTIVAKDANTCQGSSATIVITSAACPTITINTTVVGSELCAPANSNVGQITVNASGSTGLMYRLGTVGTYQSSNIFNALNSGSYTVGVIDANGCTSTSNATVSNLPQGALFTNVKAILAINCAFAGCHAGANPQNGINFTIDCTIVAQKDRINARAVVAGTMPPSGAISAADKQKITDWINAGGKYSN